MSVYAKTIRRCASRDRERRLPSFVVPKQTKPVLGFDKERLCPVISIPYSFRVGLRGGVLARPLPVGGRERTGHDAAVVTREARVFDDRRTPW